MVEAPYIIASVRRLILSLLMALCPVVGMAQDAYPSRSVRMVIDTSPGGVTDLFGRLMAEALAQKLGQTVFVDNKPGASGNLAIDFLVRAAPDGYTLMIASGGGLVVKPFLEHGLTFDVMNDLAPVFNVAETAHILVVPPAVPAKDIAEFIAYAKAQPKPLHYGSAGFGSPPHLSMELFARAAGLKMVHVPYRGVGGAMPDLLAGRVQAMSMALGSASQSCASGSSTPAPSRSAARSNRSPSATEPITGCGATSSRKPASSRSDHGSVENHFPLARYARLQGPRGDAAVLRGVPRPRSRAHEPSIADDSPGRPPRLCGRVHQEQGEDAALLPQRPRRRHRSGRRRGVEALHGAGGEMGPARRRQAERAPRHVQLRLLGRRRQCVGNPLQPQGRLHLDLRAGRPRGPRPLHQGLQGQASRHLMPLVGAFTTSHAYTCPSSLRGLLRGLDRAKRIKTAQEHRNGRRRDSVPSTSCASRITYEPGGRGFKSCRARQTTSTA